VVYLKRNDAHAICIMHNNAIAPSAITNSRAAKPKPLGGITLFAVMGHAIRAIDRVSFV
jgi:hypothetical protein